MGRDLYKVSTGIVDVARYMPLDIALILVEALMDAPTIEPGPKLKFCGDCKHFHQGEPYSMCYRTPYPYIVDGDKDYCSFVDEGR